MRPSLLHLLSLAAIVGACAPRQQAAEKPATPAAVEFLTPYGPTTRPFSPAVRVGGLLFLAGQIGTSADAGGTLVPGGIEAETRQTLENIKDVLAKTGSSMDRIVKCTVFMADMKEWDRMNVVYSTFFPGNKPARTALGSTGLALGARLEIECIAAAG